MRDEFYDITVPDEAAGQRADVFLTAVCDGEDNIELTRSAVQRLLGDGDVVLVGSAVETRIAKSYRVAAGDTLRVRIPAPIQSKILPEKIPLETIYEDDDIIVVNKPAGLVVHPGAGHSSGTLVNALLYHCAGNLSGIGGVERPGIVHRLDKDTSGLIVAAKNDVAHRSLTAQLADRTMTRIYNALCVGHIKSDVFTVDVPVGRHPRDRQRMAAWTGHSRRGGVAVGNTSVLPAGYRHAVTHITVLERVPSPRLSLIEARLETGRTHQIRVHMAHVGYPVWGDTVYSRAKQPPAKEGNNPTAQMLHARRLELVHPVTGRAMIFETSVQPHKFLP